MAMVVGGSFMIKCRVAVMGCQSALATNLGHVFTVLTDCLSPLASRLSGFLWREFVSVSASVSGSSALTGDFALCFFIHRCETACLRRLRHC